MSVFVSRNRRNTLNEPYPFQPQAFNSLTRALERHKSASPELDGANRAQHSPSRRESRGAHFDSNQDSSHLEDKGLSADTSASDTGGVPTENTTPASPVHVPGHFIDSHETAGLPGTDDLERYASKQAAQVVRAHTARKGRKGGFGLRKKKRSSSRNSGTYSDSDVEKYANSSQSANPSLPAGGGILSALLTLYNDSGATQSAASTPGTSTAPSRDTRKSTSPGVEPRKHRETASWDSLGSALGLHTPVAPLPAARANKEPSLLSRRAQAPLSLLGLNNRPPQTRSSGGVLGPLIASTGNIAGAAAPHSSRIAPNVKRPGYHLSKYVHRFASGVLLTDVSMQDTHWKKFPPRNAVRRKFLPTAHQRHPVFTKTVPRLHPPPPRRRDHLGAAPIRLRRN